MTSIRAGSKLLNVNSSAAGVLRMKRNDPISFTLGEKKRAADEARKRNITVNKSLSLQIFRPNLNEKINTHFFWLLRLIPHFLPQINRG